MDRHISTPSSVPKDLQPQAFPLGGHCPACGLDHQLPAGAAVHYACDLMAALDRHGNIDLFSGSNTDSRTSTAPLFGEERGKMFGVLEGIDGAGRTVILHAFSGQFNGRWNIPGWAPPLFCETAWQTVNNGQEPRIKELTAEIRAGLLAPDRMQLLKRQRKKCSQRLMSELHSLYCIANFRGERAKLGDFYPSGSAPPTGAGDCCAPKLLNLARKNAIVPLSIAEFYWGRPNRSATRRHGRFYPACREKCGPLIGFMLCGLDNRLP